MARFIYLYENGRRPPLTELHQELVCGASELNTILRRGKALFTCPKGNVATCQTASTSFGASDPKAKLIVTIAGDVQDTVYERRGKQWRDCLYDKRRHVMEVGKFAIV